MTLAFDLRLPEPERRRAAALVTPWRDLLYVPGPDFSSALEPGLYRSSFLIVPAEGRAVRVSSFVVPAFGGELCRVRLEPLVDFRPDNLGSFFEPRRRGMVYAMSRDRRDAGARPPDRAGWSYDGPSLAHRLERVAALRLLRERVTGGSGDSAFCWTADRGLVLEDGHGRQSLLLASAEYAEHAVFLPAVGLFRALVDPASPAVPGATVRDLLGYGDRDEPLGIDIEIEAL